jgi:hypothetical protein
MIFKLFSPKKNIDSKNGEKNYQFLMLFSQEETQFLLCFRGNLEGPGRKKNVNRGEVG